MSESSPAGLSATLGALSQTLLTDDTNLQDGLRRVATAGCSLLPNCTSASVTIIEHGLPSTMGATNETAVALDRTQYELRDGPCLAAALESRTIRIDDMSIDGRWPGYSRVAGELGVTSSLSVPLRLTDDDNVGGLNIYGGGESGFSEHDEHLVEAFATQASIVVAKARSYGAAFELTRNLTAAMESRAVIEQAKGMLMGTQGVTADGAFDLLRHRSQQENRKLRDVAAEMTANALREQRRDA